MDDNIEYYGPQGSAELAPPFDLDAHLGGRHRAWQGDALPLEWSIGKRRLGCLGGRKFGRAHDGSAWAADPTNRMTTTEDLKGIGGSSGQNVWFVGGCGTLLSRPDSGWVADPASEMRRRDPPLSSTRFKGTRTLKATCRGSTTITIKSREPYQIEMVLTEFG